MLGGGWVIYISRFIVIVIGWGFGGGRIGYWGIEEGVRIFGVKRGRFRV